MNLKRWGIVALIVVLLGVAGYAWYRADQAKQQEADRAAAQALLDAAEARFDGYKEVTMTPGTYLDATGTAPAVVNLRSIVFGTTFYGEPTALMFLGVTETSKSGGGLLAVYPCFSNPEELMPGLYCERTLDFEGYRLRYDPTRWTLNLKKIK